MRATRLAVLMLLGVTAAQGEDWQATLTPPQPGNFPPLRPLHASYRFGWGSLNAANATFDSSTTADGLSRLEMRTTTEGLVRSLWRMDARQIALCHADSLRPVSARQTETYKREVLRTTLDFDDAGVARLRESTPPDKNPAKVKRFDFSGVFDLYSALLFVRSQSLQPGEVVRIVVYPATDPYLAELEVVGREKLAIAGKSREAVKLQIRLRRIAKDLTLEKHQKFKRASAWLSDDADRLLLKIAADIAVGSVWCELQTVKFVPP